MTASKLIRPSTEYKDSYLEALSEYHQEKRYSYQEIAKLSSDEAFKDFVDDLCSEQGRLHQPMQDWVEPMPETVLWLVKDGTYLGTIEIRHRLNWHLEKWGGHVHFVIRPTMRGKGYGKKILKKAMPVINYLGIDKALLTVAPENKEAVHIIEQLGGKFDDLTPATECFPALNRYWLDCS